MPAPRPRCPVPGQRTKRPWGGVRIGGGSKARTRLDILLVQRGLCESRERARALILAGKIRVDGRQAQKAGVAVPEACEVDVVESLPYVSRGGIKLAAALDRFRLDPAGLRVLDAGISTGGFTDCLLQQGAAQVVGVDVGYGQVDWRLRSNPRVVLVERTNIRYITADTIGGMVDAAVADVSFISLEKVFPAIFSVVNSGGWLVALVKPQFEVGRTSVGKGGIVRDEKAREEAVERVIRAAENLGGCMIEQMPSPVTGAKGNIEYLIKVAIPRAGE